LTKWAHFAKVRQRGVAFGSTVTKNLVKDKLKDVAVRTGLNRVIKNRESALIKKEQNKEVQQLRQDQ